MLTPGQKPTENRRTKSCPGVGQCEEVRAWKPGKYPNTLHAPMPPLFLLPLSSTKSAAPLYPTVLATFSVPVKYVPSINTETVRKTVRLPEFH